MDDVSAFRRFKTLNRLLALQRRNGRCWGAITEMVLQVPNALGRRQGLCLEILEANCHGVFLQAQPTPGIFARAPCTGKCNFSTLDRMDACSHQTDASEASDKQDSGLACMLCRSGCAEISMHLYYRTCHHNLLIDYRESGSTIV
jgi:hypothetical protein